MAVLLRHRFNSECGSPWSVNFTTAEVHGVEQMCVSHVPTPLGLIRVLQIGICSKQCISRSTYITHVPFSTRGGRFKIGSQILPHPPPLLPREPQNQSLIPPPPHPQTPYRSVPRKILCFICVPSRLTVAIKN